MSIFVLNSQDSSYSDLTETLAKYIELEFFDDEKDLLEKLVEDGDAVLINLDDEHKKKDKLIKKLKSKFDDLPIFLLCNSLEPKKMAKHQNSKYGGHLYFRSPVDESVLLELLSEYFDVDTTGGQQNALPSSQLESIHNEKTSIGIEAEQASSDLDDVMSSVFVEDYAQAEEDKKEKDKKVDELSLDEAEEDIAEFSLDESDSVVSTQDDDGDSEFNLDEDEGGFEMSLDEEPASLEEASSGEMLVEEDLSLGEEEDYETIFPDEDDLAFPDAPAAGGASESQELSLSGQDDDIVENPIEDEGFSFDVDDSLDLAVSESGEEVESMEMDDGALDLDAEKLVIDVDEDSDSASQVFDLGQVQEESGTSDDDDMIVPKSEGSDSSMEFGLGEDDIDFNLKADPESFNDLDEDLDIGTDVSDHEITKPISTSQLEALNLDAVESEQEDELEVGNIEADSMDLSLGGEDVDLLLAESEETDNEDEEGFTKTEIESGPNLPESPDIDDLLFSDSDTDNSDDTATIIGVAIENTEISSGLEEAAPEGVTMVSEIGEELPEFSTTVERKIQEIDGMLDEDEDEDEATRVFTAPVLPDQGLSEESEEDGEDEEETRVFTADKLTELKAESRDHSSVSEQRLREHQEYTQSHDDELMRLGETIKTLREDRDRWMEKVSEYEDQKDKEKSDFLNIQAQLDESRIENSIMKKRNSKKVEELKYQLDLSDDRREALIQKNKLYQQEIEGLSKKTKVDVRQVRARERELEEKLEMLKADAEIQIKNRDHKILDLKRRIDTLEFDIESSHAKEQQSVSGKNELEDKMSKVIRTLRSAINHLEDDQTTDERMRSIKKNLDV